jgi:hypothetical protein
VDNNEASTEPSRAACDAGAVAHWKPSERLRDRLLVGLFATLAACLLSGIGTGIELMQGAEARGLSLSDVLDLVAILPEMLILAAFLGIARETRSLALWRSAIAFYLIGWLFVSSGALALLGLPVAWPILIAWVGGGLIGSLFAVFRRPKWYSAVSVVCEPESDAQHSKASEASESKSEATSSTGLGCFSVLGLLALIRIAIRVMKNADKVDWTAIIIAVLGGAIALVLCLLLVLPITCFGIAKIGLRSKLGRWAICSGLLDFLGAALVTALFGWAAYHLFQDQDPFTESADQLATICGGVYSFFYGIVTAGLFLAVRGRSPFDWRDELLANPHPPSM